jgi:hypothetical protein
MIYVKSKLETDPQKNNPPNSKSITQTTNPQTRAPNKKINRESPNEKN